MTTIKGISPNPQNLTNVLTKTEQKIAKFINMNESEADLTNVRLGQDIAVNWVPKVPFSRSFADFTDMSFLEFSENALVYFGPRLLGENLFRKLFAKKLDKPIREMVSTTAEDLLKEKNKHNKELLPVKAAIATAALAIPLAEYSLNFVKNVFTLKLFKKANFNTIANLSDKEKETPEHQQKVKDSAKKHIKLAGTLYAGCLAVTALLLTRGKKSKVLQGLSELILAPGSKLFKNNEKKAATINKYFGLDFASKEVKDKLGNVVKDSFGNTKKKMVLSNGQLASCVIVGGFGYFGSAKDRGKQNFLEVLYRFPLVGFYVITGSAMFEKGFKGMLKKKDAYKDIFSEKDIPKLKDLPQLAQKIANKNKTTVEAEYKRLFKQKSTIVMAPFLFSVGVMGMFVAGVSRYFTQYRYNQDVKKAGGQEGKLN